MQILILVGLKGVGKTTVANLLAARGWPTIEPGNTPLEQIKNLAASGQKQIALDGVSWENFQQIYHAYAADTLVVGVIAPKALRRHRLMTDTAKNLSEAEILECDRIEIEELKVGNLLARADDYLNNCGSVADLTASLDHLLENSYN